jgi:antitoxin component of MazEF toxin-antitoxin module
MTTQAQGQTQTASRYILNLAGKRQITLPKELVDQLQLETGDQIEIRLHGPSNIQFIPCTRVRRDVLTPEIAKQLKEVEEAIDSGREQLVSLAELDRAAEIRDRVFDLRRSRAVKNLRAKEK